MVFSREHTVSFYPQATQRARARWETGQKVAMEKAAAEAVEEREKALENARRVRRRQKHPVLLLYPAAVFFVVLCVPLLSEVCNAPSFFGAK